ncbi:hypothetical protein B0H19DRAFT_1068781 [Mycena capillaripes]|nr:hypothetical protein B0H19DRAFT_1068781 [Mycena capillaripes]
MPQALALPPYDTLGPVEFGLIISTFLFGIETLQTFNYYRNYPEDSLPLKILVAVVWLLELGHSICGWHGVYSVTVTFYGQPEHILDPPQSLGLVALFSSVLITLVQGFFCVRIRRISGRWHLACLCFLFSAVPLVGTIAIVFIFHTHASFLALQTGIGRVILVITTALQPPAHITIAAVLCYNLWGFKDPEPRDLNHPMKMQRVLDKVIIWTIGETSFLVSHTPTEIDFEFRNNDHNMVISELGLRTADVLTSDETSLVSLGDLILAVPHPSRPTLDVILSRSIEIAFEHNDDILEPTPTTSRPNRESKFLL